ncbi:MAG: dockerin type I repeat-containing protein [Planctomycetota bacterium]|nr:dockerin type I repeat-containing protein [Planctomycetota bacterium]
MLNWKNLTGALCLMISVSGLQAQNFALHSIPTSGLPGSSIEATVELETPSPAQGFQFGIVHDTTLLTAILVTEGSALAGANAGSGADYFHFELAPIGGPGVIVGAIVSLAPPLESIPVGTHQVAVIQYSLIATAEPGSISNLTFNNTLGSPAVNCVISVGGVSQQPILDHGSISVETQAPSAVSVTVDDPCTCDGTLSWTNGGLYDSIEITRDGVTTSHLGTDTSLAVALTDGVTANFGVVGIRNLQASAAALGSGTCNQTPPSIGPSDLVCTIDHESCTVTMSWTNNDPTYQDLTFSVDGILVGTLLGTATSTTHVLTAELVDFSLEIGGSGGCGEAMPTVSCVMVCLPERFKRGDVNSDGGVDISDAIGTLSYLFQATPSPCLDAVDTNDDGNVDISDAISVLNYIFAGGAEPPAPGPNTCGIDSTADALDCPSYNTAICN